MSAPHARRVTGFWPSVLGDRTSPRPRRTTLIEHLEPRLVLNGAPTLILTEPPLVGSQLTTQLELQTSHALVGEDARDSATYELREAGVDAAFGTGDGWLTPRDVLVVINYLNAAR